MMVSLLSFIVVIAICVIIHEGGHFAAAVWRGVQVHDFSFGMGPAIVSKRSKGGVLWAWRLFPIGGYVRLEGEEEENREGDDPDPSRSIYAKKPWERFVVVAGGAVMNIILAWLLTSFLLSAKGVNDLDSPVVGRLLEGKPAALMGALPGDRVLSINGNEITEWYGIRAVLREMDTDEVSVTVRRGGAEVVLTGKVPFDEQTGVRLWGVEPSRIEYPAHKALFVGMSYCWKMSVQILRGLWGIIAGTEKADIAGPIGIAGMAGDAAREGGWTFVTFLAVINLNLGLLNLLPLPALDGGRIVFILGEMISGRKFPETWERRIHFVGLIAFLALIALVTWKDILRLLAN
ncbi:MAG: M50 family metallopeptidase [Synergistaceae bacterium]|jgi:regulator of sigma E protease|nr:M50 family metallopeptidase [Synergistaceae bacterium]